MARLCNLAAHTADVVSGARDWADSVLVYVHVLRVRRRVGRIDAL